MIERGGVAVKQPHRTLAQPRRHGATHLQTVTRQAVLTLSRPKVTSLVAFRVSTTTFASRTSFW
jgi:hypothetical protein